MDEPMDVDEPFATRSKQITPQKHLEDFQSNKENAVNPNISYEDLDVSEMDMKLRMSMSMSCTPMASPAIKVDSRRNIGLTTSVMNEQPNYLNAYYKNVADVPCKSLDVSMSDMSIDDADTTLVLNSTSKIVRQTSDIINTIHLQKDDRIETETPQPSFETKEPLKVTANEANRNNASLYVGIDRINIPGTNMNESSPIIRGLRSVINLFRPSQSPIPQSSSPLVDDNIVCVSDSSNASPNTPHVITISDDDEPEQKQESVTDNSSISATSSPQTCQVKKQMKKEEKENKSSTSEGVVFKEEFINDLQWNDDSTIIFNTRRSSQSVRFSSSSSESPCDLATPSGPHSFINLPSELAADVINMSKSNIAIEKHSTVEDSNSDITQNIALESKEFQNQTVERKENKDANKFSVNQDISNSMSVTELTESKYFNDTTNGNTQNTTIIVKEVLDKPNTTVNLGTNKTIDENYNIQNTHIELETLTNISLNVTAETDNVNIEDKSEIILNNDCNKSYRILEEDRTIQLKKTNDDSKSFIAKTEIDKTESESNIEVPLDNSNQNIDANSITHIENLKSNTDEEAINKSLKLPNMELKQDNISEDIKTNTIIENCEQKCNIDTLKSLKNELRSDAADPTIIKIESTIQLTGNDENNVPINLNIPEHFSDEVSVEDSKKIQSLVIEFDKVKMTLNQQNCSTENSLDLSSKMNYSNVNNVISDDDKFKSDLEDNKFTIDDCTTINVEPVGCTEETKDSVISHVEEEAENFVEVINESKNLDKSIYELAHSEHQDTIADFDDKYYSNSEYNITSLQENNLFVSPKNNESNKVSETKANNVLQKECPIARHTEFETSEEVEIAHSNKTKLKKKEIQIIEKDVEKKEPTGIDFDHLENAFATITRVATTSENLSPSKTINMNETVELHQVPTTRSDSTMIIQNSSINISKEIVQEAPEAPSTVTEHITSNEIADTKKTYSSIDNIENPFATKTKIRDSFSPSKECTEFKNNQLDNIDYICMNKSKDGAVFDENTIKRYAPLKDLKSPFITKTNIIESASPSKECIDAGKKLFECTKNPSISTPKTIESETLTRTNRKYETVDNSLVGKVEICDSGSSSKKCTKVEDEFDNSTKDILVQNTDVANLAEVCKASIDPVKKEFNNIIDPFITKTNLRDSASPSKECTNVKNKFHDSTMDTFTQNTEIEESLNMCKESTYTDPGEIQFNNIVNPFITKTIIRNSASPSEECTNIRDNFVDQTKNAFTAKPEINKSPKLSNEGRKSSDMQFDSIKNPFVTKTKIRDSASPSKEFIDVQENLFQCTENPFVTKSKIRESPSPTHESTDAGVKHFDQITLTANITDQFNTIGATQLGYFSSPDEEMMELDRSIEEEFQAGELFADPDAFDYFMSRTNKNEALDKGKESLFLKFDPLYSTTTNSDGVVSSLAKLSRNRMCIGQNPDKTITIDDSDDDIGETTFMANTGVDKIEMNPTISVSNSTFHAHHDPSKVEHISDVSVIIHEQSQSQIKHMSTNSAYNDETNSALNIQSNHQIKTLNENESLVKESQLSVGCDFVKERAIVMQNVTANVEKLHSPNAMAEPMYDGLDKTVLISNGNPLAIQPQNEEMNVTITHSDIDETEKPEKIIAAKSPSGTSFIKTSSYAQAADINKQTVQNTFTVSQDTTKIINNTNTMQHSFNNTFDKVTGSVTEKPTMMVSPAINSGKITAPNRSTPPSTDRENVTTPVSPAMAVINRILFERTSPPYNSHDATHAVNVEANRADTVPCDIASSHYQQHSGDEYNQLQQETRLMLDKISEYELRLKNLKEENTEKDEKINHLQNKLTEKSSENRSMANVMEEYERTISQLISEREAEKSKRAEERRNLLRELDEQTAHLASMEYSFNDLHTKYERSKVIVKGYRTNEETLKKTIADNEVNFRKLEANYDLLRQHANAKLTEANEELDKINKHHNAEIVKLNALIKRKEMLASSLQESLIQAKKDNEQLTAICDELINKVG